MIYMVAGADLSYTDKSGTGITETFSLLYNNEKNWRIAHYFVHLPQL